MQLYDAMRTTPAVREFTDDPLPDETLHRILDHARFAPSGGNRQAARVIVVREQATREALVELTKPGARRYTAQRAAGENPWNSVVPSAVTAEQVAATEVPEDFTRPVLTAPVVLVVCVDLARVAAMDSELGRVGIAGGASVYPLVWNILLAARQEGFGGTITTMAVAEEPGVKELLGIPASYAVACVVPLGRPVTEITRLRRRPVEELAVLERFDGQPLTVTAGELDLAAIERERARIRREYLAADDTRPASTARGLHHFAIVARDVEETVRFYQGILGFPLTEIFENRDYPGSNHFFFDLGNGNLLAFFDFPGLDVGDYAEVLGGLHHVCISVEPGKWAELRDRLDEHGVEYLEESGSSIYFRDPNGARLELISDPLGEMYGARVL